MTLMTRSDHPSSLNGNYPISPHVYRENCNFWIRHMVAGGRREGLSQLNAKGELKSTFAQKVGV